MLADTPDFFLGAEDPNLCLYTCMTDIFLTEPILKTEHNLCEITVQAICFCTYLNFLLMKYYQKAGFL